MKNKDIFLQAINEKKIVKVKVNSKSKWIIIRNCIPFDFWPSKKFKDWLNRFHFLDLDSPEKKHNLSVLPERLLEIELTDKIFEPWEYVKWIPDWFVKRDWWEYS